MKEKIGFIGSGNMGEALIKGLLQSGRAEPGQILACDLLKERLDYIRHAYQVAVYSDLGEMASLCHILILAVKPQSVPQVLENYRPLARKEQLLISVAAGVPLALLEGSLPPGSRVIRVMPNTPALILNGVAALSPGKAATESDLDKAREIFSAVGETVVLEEKLMDAVTGLSGSGPAYVFVFLESLIDGGVRMGLPREVARLLAVHTVIGAARMVLEENQAPALLKEMVTSPGGTTMAGLYQLEKGGLRGMIMGAVEAATIRSRELGQGKG